MFFRRAAARAAAIDERAHHAATSPHNDRPEPTRAQRDAGNYKHGHVQVQGLRIAIENPVGSVRSGVTREGKIWRTVLQHHYGRIKGTEGADGDQVDVFIGPHPESELVFVIDQVIDGAFDEHKCVVGARSEAEAREIYLANYQRGWKGLDAITALPIAEFKQWLAHHDTTTPMAANRVPAALRFWKANPGGDVLRPGVRGGRFYFDDDGRVRYGARPTAPAPVAAPSSRAASEPVSAPKSEAGPASPAATSTPPASARPEAAKTYAAGGPIQPWEVLEDEYLTNAFKRAVANAERNATGWAQEAAGLPVGRPTKKTLGLSKRDQALASATHWRERAAQLQKDGPTPAMMQGWRDAYIETVKKALSKGQPVPAEVIRQRPEFEKARDNRERYDKGRHTSFANESAAVNREHQRDRGYKVKRQDGKPIGAAQVDSIHQGVSEVEQVLGPLADLFRRSDLTIADTSGKFPFLMVAGGVYHGADRTVTIGIKDVLGRPVPALAHELGHWLDNEAGAALGKQSIRRGGLFHRSRKTTTTPSLATAENDSLMERARRTMNRTREVRVLLDRKLGDQETPEAKAEVQRVKVQLGPYWDSPSEIFARLTEQYVTTVRGQGGLASEADYTNMPGWWTAAEFAPLMPLISKEIGRRIAILGGDPSHVTGAKVDLAAPAHAAGFADVAEAQAAVRADLTGGFPRTASRAADLKRRIELNRSHAHLAQWESALSDLQATLAQRDARVGRLSDEARAALLNRDADTLTSVAEPDDDVAKAQSGGLLRRVLRRMFGKANVQQPGSRGGHYYIDHAGQVRYGTPPTPNVGVFDGIQSRRQHPTILPRSGYRFAGQVISGPADTARIFRDATTLDRERLYALHMDADGKPLAIELLTQGHVTFTSGSVREVLRNAVNMQTKRMAIIHNHPSGRPSFSQKDLDTTKLLMEVADDVGIEIDHHVVVGFEGYNVIDAAGRELGPFSWGKPAKGKQLPGVEGRSVRQTPWSPWAIFEQAPADPRAMAQIARAMLEPSDRIGLLFAVDQGNRVTGVFPLAHDSIDDDTVRRVTELTLRSAATQVVLAFSSDGKEWMEQLAREGQRMFDAVTRASTEVMDYVVVADQSFVSWKSGGMRKPL